MTANQEIAERLDVSLSPATQAEQAADPTGEAADDSANSDADSAEELPSVEVGTELSLEGESLGDQPGKAQMAIGAMTLQATVSAWSDTEATIQLPTLELTNPVAGQLSLFNAAGELVSSLDVQFVPPSTPQQPVASNQ